jgi:fatty-acyl-CoA synthase
VDFVTSYGATETTALITASYEKPYADLSEEEATEVHQKGLPVTGVRLHLVDPETDDPVPRDGVSVGEVLVKSPWTTGSYSDDPKTAEAFTDDGFWRSGDLATMDGEGYVQLVDRLKDGIKSGGEWISSVDMENKLVDHAEVADAAVVGLDHAKWDERPFAVVERAGSVEREGLLDHLREEFADWQLPDEIEFVDEVPKTSVGKRVKGTVRDHYEGRYLEG